MAADTCISKLCQAKDIMWAHSLSTIEKIYRLKMYFCQDIFDPALYEIWHIIVCHNCRSYLSKRLTPEMERIVDGNGCYFKLLEALQQQSL